MILQAPSKSAPSEAPRFVQRNVEHTVLAAQLAAQFGNAEFASLEPRDEMLYLVAHHDHGWQGLDEDPPLNPDGMPFHLGATPIDHLLGTSSGSPDFNEQHSDLCGLLSSMHTYGLYRGRYGLSDAVTMDFFAEADRARVEAILDDELVRQQRLKTSLAGQAHAGEEEVFNNYKLLQFFDSAALYFNVLPAGERGTTTFRNVPQALNQDVSIQVTELEAGIYGYSPFPFDQEGVEVYCEGRYLVPNAGTESGREVMASQPVERQYFKLVAG